MPLKLEELVNETKDDVIEVGDEEVHLTFYLYDSVGMQSEALESGRVTKEDIEGAADENATPFFRNAVMLAMRLKCWDWRYLADGGTEPLPLNVTTLVRLRGRYFEPLRQAVFGKPDEQVPSEPSPSPNG